MRRRRVWVVAAAGALVLLGSASLSAEAQSPRMPRIALLSTGTDPGRPLVPQWVAFLETLRTLGHVEGQNLPGLMVYGPSFVDHFRRGPRFRRQDPQGRSAG